jgi:hypothetical protein
VVPLLIVGHNEISLDTLMGALLDLNKEEGLIMKPF